MTRNVNKKLFLYKDPNEKGINDYYNEPNLTNKFKNIRIKSKVEAENKKSKNKKIKAVLFFLMEQKKKS